MKRLSDFKFQFYLYDNGNRTFAEIHNGTTFGRVEGDIQYPKDDLISRKHCQFIVVGNEIYIEDFDSTNKTRVNTVPIQSNRKRRIRLHDVIEFGTKRFILTNQDKHIPGNIHDMRSAQRLYRGTRKDDGSVTAMITGFISQRTSILLNRPEFRRLKLRHKLGPIRRNSSTLTLLLGCAFFWYSVYYFAIAEGALGAGFPHTNQEILGKFLSIAFTSTAVLFLMQKWILRPIFKRRSHRNWALGATSLFAIGISFWGSQKTGLLKGLHDNVSYYQSVASRIPASK